MAKFLGLLIGAAGLGAFALGVIALFRPMPSLKLPTRGRAALALIGGFILMAFGGSLLPPESPNAPKPPASVAADNEKTLPAYSIGQPVDQDGYRMIITRVLERQRVGNPILAEAASTGGVLVVVEYTLENRTDRPMSAFRFPIPVLIDPNGVVYKADVGKSGAYTIEGNFDRKLMSDLNPGIQVKDAQVFEVSRQTFSRDSWQLGIDGATGPRISLKESTVANSTATTTIDQTDYSHEVTVMPSDCRPLKPASERILCENPDLLKRNDNVGKRLLGFMQRHPDDPRVMEIRRGVGELERQCDTRQCVELWTSRWERISDEWGI